MRGAIRLLAGLGLSQRTQIEREPGIGEFGLNLDASPEGGNELDHRPELHFGPFFQFRDIPLPDAEARGDIDLGDPVQLPERLQQRTSNAVPLPAWDSFPQLALIGDHLGVLCVYLQSGRIIGGCRDGSLHPRHQVVGCGGKGVQRHLGGIRDFIRFLGLVPGIHRHGHEINLHNRSARVLGGLLLLLLLRPG
jgi:hypothetical protein